MVPTGLSQAPVTKSMSSSTRPSNSGSRSAYDRTVPRMRFHARAMSAWSACGQPSASQMPCFQSVPAWDHRPCLDAETFRLHRLPDVDERVTDDEDVRDTGELGRDPRLLRAGHQVIDEDPQTCDPASVRTQRRQPQDHRCRRGVRRRLLPPAGRRPTPSRRARHRGVPRPRCVTGVPPWPARRRRQPIPMPSASVAPALPSRARSARLACRQARTRARVWNVLRTLRRSSRSTVPRSGSTRTISPHHPVVTSSTTRPRSAVCSVVRPWTGLRQSPAKTSPPYRS